MREKELCGILCILLVLFHGWNLTTVIYCLMTIALVYISVADYKTYEIPPVLNLFLLFLGIVHGIMNLSQWRNWLIGALIVSLPLAIAFYLTAGRAVGGGDIKMMAACGLILGWRNILNAFFIGCILAIVIHSFRMKQKGTDKPIAMGPYLAAGIYCTVLLEHF